MLREHDPHAVADNDLIALAQRRTQERRQGDARSRGGSAWPMLIRTESMKYHALKQLSDRRTPARHRRV